MMKNETSSKYVSLILLSHGQESIIHYHMSGNHSIALAETCSVFTSHFMIKKAKIV